MERKRMGNTSEGKSASLGNTLSETGDGTSKVDNSNQATFFEGSREGRGVGYSGQRA